MALSGKTAAPYEAPYYLSTDKPPDLAAMSKAMSERNHALFSIATPAAAGTTGQLIVVQSTGAPAFKAMKGDATIADDGTLTIGGEKVTLAKLAAALALPESYLAAAVQTKLNNERVPLDGTATSRKVKLTGGIIAATESLTLAAAYADVPGVKLEITPTVASILKVTIVARYGLSGASPIGAATIKVDAEAEEAQQARTENVAGVITAMQVYRVPLSAAGHTIQMRARKEASGATCEVAKSGTQMMYELLAS